MSKCGGNFTLNPKWRSMGSIRFYLPSILFVSGRRRFFKGILNIHSTAENKYFCRNCEKFAVWNRSLNQLSNIWLALLEQDTICPERDRVWNWIFLNSRMSWLLEMCKFEWIMQLPSKQNWVKVKFKQLYFNKDVIGTFRLIIRKHASSTHFWNEWRTKKCPKVDPKMR